MEEVKIFIPKNLKTKYVTNIQSHKGKGNIHYQLEPENPYDSKAVIIYTYNQKKERVDLGYIQKKQYIGRNYTKEAQELYEEYQWIIAETGDYNDLRISELKGDDNWGKYTSNQYKYLLNDEELQVVLDNIDNQIYNFRYSYDEDCGYLRVA
jgi:hypothetical protein